MIGKTPVILDGAGLPRRESVVEPVPDVGRHRAGSRDAKPGLEFAVACPELSPGLPALVLSRTFCRIRRLGAAPEANRYYAELVTAAEFTSTVAWGTVDPAAFDGLLLPGGHAPGMRP